MLRMLDAENNHQGDNRIEGFCKIEEPYWGLSHPGWTPDFKWRGWSKDLLGLKFSIPKFFGLEQFDKY